MRLVALIVVLAWAACSGADEEGIRGCPRPDWPGPWTACAEARWVERVVQAGVFEVEDARGTGSALIAAGDGRRFYVWATSTGSEESDPADEGVRTTWSAQGFTFLVESGPRSTDVKPTVEELTHVVAASTRIAPPPPDE